MDAVELGKWVAGSSTGVQTLVRYLVQNPGQVGGFLTQPADTMRRLGVKVETREVDILRAAILEMSPWNRVGPKAIHYDFPECDHIEVPGIPNPR
ncbi:MAG: hypothetical protein R6X16_04675 [Anaerolineae bacterium]